MLELTGGEVTLEAKRSVRWQLWQNLGERRSGLHLDGGSGDREKEKCFRDSQRVSQQESVAIGGRGWEAYGIPPMFWM